MWIKKFLSFFTLLLTFLLFSPVFFSGEDVPQYDVLIKNGRIYDGSLKEALKADLALKQGRIVKISPSLEDRASRIIDAEGLFVTPGFIDLHTHVDEGMYFPENRACLNFLTQGVTTVIVGHCGASGWPLVEKAEDQMKRWAEEGIGPNSALLVGHGDVRRIVMGEEDRAPTPEELEKMKSLVREAMEQGASGLSTGLIYVPGNFSKTDEIIELVKIVKPYGGIYHTHVRNEGPKLIEAIKEAIEIAEKTGVPTHISHFKVLGKENWGKVKEACQLIEAARSRGLKITADQYPYQFSSGYPYRSLIPRNTWLGGNGKEVLQAEDLIEVFDNLRDSELIEIYKKTTPYYPFSLNHEEFLKNLSHKRLVQLVFRSFGNVTQILQGPENFKERMLFWQRMKNPEEGSTIREEVRNHIEKNLSGAENVIVAICGEKELEGKTLKEVAEIKGKSIEDTAIELELMGAKCIPFQMCEDDIEYIMKKEYVGTGSDGTSPFYGIGLTHIRSYSTFLHKIKKYALERKAVSVAHVIRSQTSLPAEIMNWKDLGWIKEGYRADIAILDLENLRTETSISNPHVYSQGVKYLIINGELVIEEGRYTGKLPGRVIKLKK